ncbi:unnamed protein product [Amoebophrya sp. A25]|nr:unnamed protein product [Amoebophrya sp. A25]|eukprot:GSA25T00007426001.1
MGGAQTSPSALHSLVNTHVLAVVGAACFTSSVTRTLSVAFLIFELTQQGQNSVVMLCALCVSNLVTVMLTPHSLYDLLADAGRPKS